MPYVKISLNLDLFLSLFMSILKAFIYSALLTTLGAYAAESKQMQIVGGNVSSPATQVSDGKKNISLNSFSGKFVLVNFWATWCAPCVREMPALDRLAMSLEKEEVVVLAVSQDEAGPVHVRPFVEKLNLKKLKVYYDNEKRSFRDFGLRGLPTTVLISPKGKLVARLEGSANWDEGALLEQVKNLIKK